MNRIFFIHIFILICFGVRAQQTVISDLTDVKTTLVNNQLSPELIKIENTSGFSNGSLNKSGNTTNKFSQGIFAVSGYPITLVKKRYHQLYLGSGYYSLKFSHFANTAESLAFSKKLESVYLNAASTYRIKKKVFGLLYAQSGLNGTNPFQDVSKTFNMLFISKFMYKASRNENFGLGLVYFTNMRHPLVLPALTFVYSKEKYLINVDFPLKAEVEGMLLNRSVRPVVGTSFHGGMYYLNNDQKYLYNYGALGYVGARFKLADLLYLYTGYQTGILDQYNYGPVNNLDDIGVFSGQSQFVVSLNVQFAKFIPLQQN